MLAGRYGHGPIPLAEICRIRDLARDYMTKIFNALARAEIVRPIRGRGGGYVLARQPRDISLLEVIEAIEGPLALNLCQHSPPLCEQEDCRARPVWTRLQENMRGVLSSTSLADLVCDVP